MHTILSKYAGSLGETISILWRILCTKFEMVTFQLNEHKQYT